MSDQAGGLRFDHLKPWRVCRLKRRFVDLDSANAYAAAHGARFVHVTPEANGEAAAWELEYHCERELTARCKLADLQSLMPFIEFVVIHEGRAK